MGGTIPAIVDYNTDGILKFATWNPADSTISHTTGVIPMPSDWQRSMKMDYVVYNGNPSDPVAPSKNWSLLDDVTDGSHMLYATPLTNSQMAKIGMDTSWTVIPVELTSFVGNVNGSDVKLDWTTATELNNNGFEIQKKSGNGFSTIGFVKGNGTSTSKHEYSFTDKQLQPEAAIGLKRSEGDLQDPGESPLVRQNRRPPMKWRVKSLYVNALYVIVVLSSLVAAAAAGYKWGG
jgi:hypothetical protein